LSGQKPSRKILVGPYLRLAREFAWPYRALLSLTAVLMIAEAALQGGLAYLLDPVIKSLFRDKDATMLYVLPLALFGVMLVKAAVSFGSNVSLVRVGQGVVTDLQAAMFSKVTHYDLKQLNAMHSGQFAARFLNDATLVRESVTKGMQGAVRDLLTLIALSVVMFYEDWRLALIITTALPAVALYTLSLGKKSSKAATKSMMSTGDLATHLSEVLDGRRVVKAYRMEDRSVERATRILAERMKHLMKGARARAAATPSAEALAGVGVAAVVFYGAYMGIHGTMEINNFTAFLAAMMLSYQSIRNLSNFYTAMSDGSAAAARSFELLDAPITINDALDAKPLALAQTRPHGAIRFADVTFEYSAESNAALHNVTFEVPAGKMVALVGPSGAGKSTALNLILRFYDVTGGAIEIDGQDLRGVTISSLRDQTALVTQEPFLFDDTISANIGCGRPGATQAEIEAAARGAAAHEFIMRLPQGYDTVTGEAGVRLSGGQRQRIAIARAMLRDAPILLLDEATSSLDTESERAVQAALAKLMKDRTTLVIAHRLSTVAGADRIVVLDHGRVVEQGTHGELLARNGLYARLYRTQFTDEAGPSAAVAE
jgi:subfamily B ATP-binding cassette protein MsbA